MNIKDYLERAEAIRLEKLWSRGELVKRIGFSYATWQRLEEGKVVCQFVSMRKLRDFVDKYEDKPSRNIIVTVPRQIAQLKDEEGK